MFTGIVQGTAHIIAIDDLTDLKRFTVQFPQLSLNSVTKGASIALNGVCLTVTEFDTTASTAKFDVMFQTLKLTNLSNFSAGSIVNFERAAKIGDEIGGHMMSGHIYQTCTVQDVKQQDNQYQITFELPDTLKAYILDKGYVGLNGCSLTIASVSDSKEEGSYFSVCLIPETLEVTTFSDIKPGDHVNIEVDPQTQAIVDTVERYLATKKG